MTKNYNKVPYGDGCRHRVTLKDVPSEGAAIVPRQHAFLAEFVNEGIYNGLFRCGPVAFDRLAMHHDGVCWIISMEAIEA